MKIDRTAAENSSGKNGLNLMEASQDYAEGYHAPVGSSWFGEVRFGMFVHYGLYSIQGKGEWYMFHNKIPPSEYNRLADEFTAEAFDADALVALAKEAGAGYVVLGARHHDGFCLWDTKTTDFNSVQTAAGRDLIREFVEACARADMRVGIYFSVMSWQWPAIFSGPLVDPDGWALMVKETHAQVRELMTNYGQIDYLWYDGCVVPGMGESSIRSRYWCSEKLNSMVRLLQPSILINDRAARAEDVTTPEQNLTQAPRGRTWECCQTIGGSWGWRPDVGPEKSVKKLILELVYCARFGGNYLLNIGPCADGSLRRSEEERFRGIGQWMRVHGDAIRGSERTRYTESTHLIGMATCHDRFIYFHLESWPNEHAVIAGIRQKVRSITWMKENQKLDFEQSSDGSVRIFGLPINTHLDLVEVLQVELAQPMADVTPPSLLVENDTGRNLPAEAKVHNVAEWEMSEVQTLDFEVPTLGKYDIELGVISTRPQLLKVALLSDSTEVALDVSCANYPDTLRLEAKVLQGGQHRLNISSTHAEFGVYLWRAEPIWEMLPSECWSIVGP
ncbi:MAG: alpha-L-fucosidase, partial [Puniceicoccales bacterium]